MALIHQTLPPGAYIFEVTDWWKERVTRNGLKYHMFVVKLIGTDFTTSVSLGEMGGWRELMEPPYDWISFRDVLIGRQFIFNVERSQVSMTSNSSYSNALSEPICEVLPNPQEV